VGSYFAVQLLANILKMPLQNMNSCMGPEHDDLSRSTGPFIAFLNLGISVVGTNLLYHRYLLQKAKVMVKMSVSILRIKSPLFCSPYPPFQRASQVQTN
jgi:hypothetical protein